jgi:GTP-binding protein
MVATKADKVSRGGRQKNLNIIKKTLGLIETPLFFSAETGEGSDELTAAIAQLITPK